MFEKQIDWGLKYLNNGTIDLLAQQLSSHQVEEQQSQLTQYQTLFGHQISLVDINSFDENQQAILQDGQLLTDVNSESVFKQITNSPNVISFSNIEQPAAHITAEAQWRIMGTVNMIATHLSKSPQVQWQSELNAISKSFDFMIKLVPISDIALPQAQQEKLINGDIAWQESSQSIDLEYPLETAYYQMPNSQTVLVLGPIASLFAEHVQPAFLWYYLLLSLVILLPLILWLIPTWLSLKRLSKASELFGQGEFSCRATEVKGSNVKNYTHVFNTMAAKIEGLVNVNKSLVNAVSHELRTPLSRIEFDLEMARTSKSAQDREKLHDRIETSVDELKTLVSEMLIYAKFEQEKPTLNYEQVDINAWLHTNIDSWLVDNKLISPQILSNHTIQLAFIDRYYMNRVVSNLVRNALKYAKNQVTIASSAQSNDHLIVIEDDGAGIPKSQREIIFDPFVRLDKSRNRESGGTGLGLAIVKQIMTWHNGDVTVEESSLGGAKFTIRWPKSLGKAGQKHD